MKYLQNTSYVRFIMLSAVTFVCTVLLFKPTVGYAANEKEIVIWPDQFIAQRVDQAHRQSPAFVTSLLPPGYSEPPYSNVNFYVPVDLSHAQEISGLTYFHSGSGASAYTVVNLVGRVINGPQILIMSGFSDDDTGDIIPIEAEFNSINFQLEKGYRYFLEINVDNNQGAVWGIRLRYR